MAYEPLNLKDGHVLTAADIKHIEDGIIAASGGTVTPPVKRLTIDKTVAAGAAGTDVTLGVTASDGATGLNVTWTSSDTNVAAFTKVGAAPMHKILTLVKDGTTTITAHVDGYEDDSFEFTVTVVTAASRNLLAYGPADPASMPDLHVTVTDQGSLLLKGKVITSSNISFALDPKKFTPGGTYTLSQQPAHSSAFNVRATLSHNNGASITGLWNNDHVTFKMPDPIRPDLTFGIDFSRVNLEAGVEYKPQLEAGDTVSDWVKPDVTDAKPVEA